MAALQRGEPDIDPHLRDRSNDRRRGVTLFARPSAPVREAVKNFLERVARVCPGQYLYRPEEFHVTVMGIISGTEAWEAEARHLDSYRAILREVLGRQRPFRVAFRGVTVSPGAVLIQGFPLDDGLERIRAELREAFSRAGFEGVLDRRYRITTAHMTVMRFGQADGNWAALVSLLRESREIDFGETAVRNLELTLADWYASAESVRLLEEFSLPGF